MRNQNKPPFGPIRGKFRRTGGESCESCYNRLKFSVKILYLVSLSPSLTAKTLYYGIYQENILRKYLKFILLLLFAVLIIWFFGRNLDWREVGESLRQADAFYLAAAVLIICLGYLLRAKRWQVLLAPITETSLKELFATTTVGFAAVFFVGRMGEIVRPMWLPMRDRRVRPSAALVTLGVERICDLTALIVFFAVNLLWFSAPAGRENEFASVKFVGVLMLVGVALGIGALALYAKFSAPLIEWFARASERKIVPRRIRRIFLSLLKQLAAALRIFKDWREVASVVFWTLALWFAISIPTWLVLLAFDLPLDFSASLFIMGFASVSSVVPTPGGAAGAFHTATAASLIFLNVDRNVAGAASIAMHLVYFAPAVIFGLYYFFHGDISIAKLRSLLSSEHAVEEVEHENEVGGQQSAVSGQRLPAERSPVSQNPQSEIPNPKSI
jgi:glycosyltransferase 2 family protein